MLSFYVKFVQTDRRTMVKQYAPNVSIRVHKKTCLKGLLALYSIFNMKYGLNSLFPKDNNLLTLYHTIPTFNNL